MRGSLVTHPKILRIASMLADDPNVGNQIGTGKPLRECVSRDVTRDITIAALLRVWSATNEHTSDGVWHHVEREDLDCIAGIDGFANAMEVVGWLVYDQVGETATLPNFLEYNAPAKNGERSRAAERQREYRERQKNRYANGDVTRDVTMSHREEKRREDIKPTSMSDKSDVAPIAEKNLEAKESAKRVLEFLNEKTGRAYRPVPVNIEKIVARMKEGATEGQCRQVIAKKSREWSTDERMAMYLRPATLFNREKFAQYVGELV